MAVFTHVSYEFKQQPKMCCAKIESRSMIVFILIVSSLEQAIYYVICSMEIRLKCFE